VIRRSQEQRIGVGGAELEVGNYKVGRREGRTGRGEREKEGEE